MHMSTMCIYCPQSFSGGGLYLNVNGYYEACMMGYYDACVIGYYGIWVILACANFGCNGGTFFDSGRLLKMMMMFQQNQL